MNIRSALSSWGLAVLISFGSLSVAQGQTTKGVGGGNVKAGVKSLQERFAYTPDRGNRSFGYANEILYYQSFSEDFALRINFNHQKIEGHDWEFTGVMLEAFYQLTEKASSDFDSMAVLRIRVPEHDNRPGYVRLAWNGQIYPADGWSLKGNVLIAHQYGAGSDDEFSGEIRFQIQKSFEGFNLGVDSYHSLGYIADMPRWDDQDHTIGPYLSGKIAGKVGYWIQYMFGICDRTVDQQWRIFLTLPF